VLGQLERDRKAIENTIDELREHFCVRKHSSLHLRRQLVRLRSRVLLRLRLRSPLSQNLH
jgi:hypothetical protein